MKNKIKLSDEIVAEAKQVADDLTTGEANQAMLDLFKRYEEIYFMDTLETPKNQGVDEKDWKLTASPSGRNAVVGMTRLLNTSGVKIKVKSKGDEIAASSKIEKALLAMLAASGKQRKARVEKDLNLAAVLYGPTILQVERVDDMRKVHNKPIFKKRLDDIAISTPFLLRTVHPLQSFGDWGELGMLRHLRKYELNGSALQERWGIADTKSRTKHVVRDMIDVNNRIVWVDNGAPIIAAPHNMRSLNVFVRYAGGSSLFGEPARQLQSFLYALAKGNWDKRANLFWTYLFTAIYIQGLPGPLMVVDPDSVNGSTAVEIDFTGGVRKMIAKAQAVDFPVVDRNVLEIKRMMDDTEAESTIFKQTLGQNIQGSTFSGLAMLSSAGMLPLQDPKEAVEMVLSDAFEHILCRFKDEGIEHDLLSAADIPDDYTVEVTTSPNLPQDQLRNSQVAESLGDTVSRTWKRSELLQIGDPEEMERQVLKEKAKEAIFAAAAQDPTFLQEFMKRVMKRLNIQPQPATPPEMTTQPGGEPVPPEEAMAAGAMPGQPNMPRVEQTMPMDMSAPPTDLEVQ